MLTPEGRKARARIAGLTAHAMGRTNTGPATKAAEARFRLEVLAEAEARGETLTNGDVERRTSAKRRLFYARLAYRSAQVRHERAEQRSAWTKKVAIPAGEMPGTAETTEGTTDAASSD